MTDNSGIQPAGWYYAQGDPPGTHRYWDGNSWVGGPQPVAAAPGVAQSGAYGAGPALCGLGPRIGARIIDGILIIIVGVVISLIVLGASTFDVDAQGNIGLGRRALSMLASLAFAFFYEVFLNVQFGGTPGKLMLGLRIKKADGSALDWDAAFRRYAIWGAVTVIGGLLPATAGSVFSLVSIVLVIAGMIMIGTDSLQQAPWDKVGGTIVVRG